MARQVDAPRSVSIARGSVAALRADDNQALRFIQTDANVHPGSSGGPMLDLEGYAVGVIRMKIAEESGIAFAIPINDVKNFLESFGLDSLLPVRRLRLGPLAAFDDKGLRLRVPDGFEDSSGWRTRVASAGPPEERISLAIDRIASTWSLEVLEEGLVSGRLFEHPGTPSRREDLAADRSDFRVRQGQVSYVTSAGIELRMRYALFDLGREKILARYLGPRDEMAFNAAVLQGSMVSLEADHLLVSELRAAPADALAPLAQRFFFPEGWPRDGRPPYPCPGLPDPEGAISASPPGDFTVSFRASWWASIDLGPARAARSCSTVPGAAGEGSYAWSGDLYGLPHRIEGVFVSPGGVLFRLELVSPTPKFPYVSDLFGDWIAAVARGETGGR